MEIRTVKITCLQFNSQVNVTGLDTQLHDFSSVGKDDWSKLMNTKLYILSVKFSGVNKDWKSSNS